MGKTGRRGVSGAVGGHGGPSACPLPATGSSRGGAPGPVGPRQAVPLPSEAKWSAQRIVWSAGFAPHPPPSPLPPTGSAEGGAQSLALTLVLIDRRPGVVDLQGGVALDLRGIFFRGGGGGRGDGDGFELGCQGHEEGRRGPARRAGEAGADAPGQNTHARAAPRLDETLRPKHSAGSTRRPGPASPRTTALVHTSRCSVQSTEAMTTRSESLKASPSSSQVGARRCGQFIT